MIDYSTRDPYSFLFINKSVVMKKRFRKNLDELLQIDYFKGSKKNPKFKLPEAKKDKSTSQKDGHKNGEKGDQGHDSGSDKEDESKLDKHNSYLGRSEKKIPKRDRSKRDSQVTTLAQHGTPSTQNGRRGATGGNFYEQRSTAHSQLTKQKQVRGGRFGSRRLESSYYF